MDDGVVGGVERLAVEVVGQDGGLAVVLVADDPAVAVLAGDLPALAIEGVAVGVTGRVTHHADVAVLLEPAELDVVGDVGPDQVLAHAVPGRPSAQSMPVCRRRMGELPILILAKRLSRTTMSGSG